MTQWRGREEVKRAMERYGRDAKQAILQLAQEWAPILETYAKQHRPWEDRTTNARQSLYAIVDQRDGKTTIFLSHGMDYGVYLELRNAGRYAIILPTLEAHYAQIAANYRRLFS